MGDLDTQFDLQRYLSSTVAERERMMEALFKQYYPFVYRLAFSLCGHVTEAQDVTQEVFIAAMQGLAKFRGESQLSTWLYRITTRIAGRHLARRSKHQGEDDAIEFVASREQADSEVVTSQLIRAISKLSLPMRTVLSLVAIEGVSHQVAADVLGVPVGTIWSRLYAARKKLAENMG
ncbi:MAG: RNA polymerase sigma factor [Algicola sp.]|nr:RNA polymerase sigma factor [Algicola sp.]